VVAEFCPNDSHAARLANAWCSRNQTGLCVEFGRVFYLEVDWLLVATQMDIIPVSEPLLELTDRVLVANDVVLALWSILVDPQLATCLLLQRLLLHWLPRFLSWLLDRHRLICWWLDRYRFLGWRLGRCLMELALLWQDRVRLSKQVTYVFNLVQSILLRIRSISSKVVEGTFSLVLDPLAAQDEIRVVELLSTQHLKLFLSHDLSSQLDCLLVLLAFTDNPAIVQ